MNNKQDNVLVDETNAPSDTNGNNITVTKKVEQKKGMFQKKYVARHITFYVLLIFLGLYLFTGAIATEWQGKVAHIDIADYVFIGINVVILGLVNYEILRLVGGTKWPIYTQVITYLLMVFLFLFSVESVAENYGGIGAINYPFYTLLNWNWLKPWIIFVIYLCAILVYYCLVFSSKEITFGKMTLVLIFTLYLIFAFKAMNKFMLNPDYGWSSVVWLALIIILTDTFAFVGGVSYGKHKLAPNVSPNKTWEGAATGTIMAAGIAITYAVLMFNLNENEKHWVFNFFSNDNDKHVMRYVIYVLLAFVLSILSQLGDLSFSWIKRRYDIKDFSNLLPGHGGVLDRLDSFSLVFFVMFIISNVALQR
ncbi:phosphatidate cytidylyltransferase [Spiroplasma endosymbiont of Glossina fuscipes fuscipes]|uniref:phosphatidate cytidylyltransferase n=1 Tax=Spiroplasma endosymbiont of Glossina fuscipes fuscipes TaxID=2004463 RepID=UPI003C74BBC9